MKIAVLTASVSRRAGGLFDATRRLSQTLGAECDTEVQLFGLEDEGCVQDRAHWTPVQVNVFPVKGPHALGFAPEMYQALCRMAADLSHTHGLWMYPSIAAYRWSKQLKKPYVVSPHGMLDSWALSNSRYKKILAGYLYENRHLKTASCIHALGTPEVQAIRDYGLRNPICLIPNGIDMINKPESNEAPWQNQVDSGRNVLLYLGRIHPKKGLINIIYAWSLLKSSGISMINEWAVVIVGWDQCNYEAELKAAVTKLNLANSVFFLGPQFHEKKNAAYHFANGFILPSLSEGLPMTVLEAWSHSLPVLMTPQCNIPEGFEKGAAIKIETDPKAIARGLIELFEMSDVERKEMGQRGLNLVKQQFSWSTVAVQMRQVYEWILGGGTPPECVRFD
ncbi:MAG: glycosyltransferase [Nitrospirae bacterium]|nr:glycosyltransferase [Nitrospirota bacterium]